MICDVSESILIGFFYASCMLFRILDVALSLVLTYFH